MMEMHEKNQKERLESDYQGNIMQELEGTLAYPVREYKDRVFRMLFKEKTKALELYNAMNGTEYTNTDDLVITTLENALYLGMKNDVSFVLYDQLMLYEHQATKNPNMPLRNLLYVSCVYSRLVKDENLYSTTMIKLPEPKFVVFYNGADPISESEVLKLSDAYEKISGEPVLELKTLVLNINEGYNEDLKRRSRTLYEYMVFVDAVRKYAKMMPFPEAMKEAIDECIRNGVLEDFLGKNKAEVEKVAIFEYNEEKHLQQERSEAEKRGEERGMKRGEEQLGELIDKLLQEGNVEDARKVATDETVREELYKKYGIKQMEEEEVSG